MGKIIQITESQYSKLKQKMLVESNSDDFKDFLVEAELEFELSSKYLDGRRVYGVETPERYTYKNPPNERIRVLFDMNCELTRRGLSGITIENVRGEKALAVKIELEPLTDDDEDFYYDHTLAIDWSKAEVIHEGYYNVMPKSIERVVIFLDDSFFVDKIEVYPEYN